MSAIDKLEKNLKDKIDVLEKIYECDERIRGSIDIDKSEYEDYDSYIDEKGLLLDTMARLEQEADEINTYLSEHKREVDLVNAAQRNRILELTSQVNGKAEAVAEIESQIKRVTDSFFQNKRNGIKDSRKQVRAVQGYYNNRNFQIIDNNSILDTKN